MPRREAIPAGPWRVLLIDSITQLEASDRGAVVVTGSHGGTSAAAFALAVPAALVVFNDAGVGKDAAGIAALAVLEAQGRAAATVSHLSARIGDARDAWEHGVFSHANRQALALGVRLGIPVRRGVAELDIKQYKML
jgi:hypothetical protein